MLRIAKNPRESLNDIQFSLKIQINVGENSISPGMLVKHIILLNPNNSDGILENETKEIQRILKIP